ncbi:MAG: cytochrome c, partial [Bryobacterales bacterium]|nr:cytochrome c [Bryobacterales bacterium]
MRIAALLFLPCVVGAQTDRGQTLFTQHCVVCHGATAEGGSGPDLTSAVWSRSVTDDQLQTVIRDGVRG